MPNSESTSIFVALWHSLVNLALGFFPAIIIGLLLGWMIGCHPLACQIGKRLLQIPVATPVIYVAIFLMLMQKNQPAVTLTILFSSIWFVVIYTGLGLQRAFRHNNHFDLAIPQIFLGLRLGMTMVWVALMTSEVVMSGIQGLGFYIWDAYQKNSVSNLTIGIITIIFVTFVTDQSLDLLGIFVKKLFQRKG